MNILHLNSNFNQSKIHKNIVESMNSKPNIEGRVFYPENKMTSKSIELNYVDLVPCLNSYEKIFFQYRNKHLYRVARSLYKFNDYDTILAHSLYSNGSLARVISENHKLPYSIIVTNTDYNLYIKKMKHLKNIGLKNLLGAKTIIFSSPAYLDSIINEFVPEKFKDEIKGKSVSIPFGVDDFWLDNLNYKNDFELSNRTVNVLYAGKINYNKNIQSIIEAVGKLIEQNYKIRLTIVGEPTDKYGKKLKLKNKKRNYITFINNLDFKDLINVYRANDLFVMASFKESFGLVYGEAMSQGLPVIYTKGQGFDKQFPDFTVGAPVTASSTGDIESAIKYIINNYEELSRNATTKSNTLNWNLISQRFINAIV